jgi:hypothetical protein
MPGEIANTQQFVARVEADPEFLHLLLFDTGKAAEQIADPELRARLVGIDPRTLLSGVLGRIVGPDGGIAHCDFTCGDKSCNDTCGSASCGDTCHDSCGHTCGEQSCTKTSTSHFVSSGKLGEGGTFGTDDLNRLRVDIDALIAQHIEQSP